MPELPEVETIVSQLRRSLVDATIKRVRVARSDVIRQGRRGFAARLAGRRIDRIERDGKRIRCLLSPAGELVFHLGMSGRLTIEPSGAECLKHTHIRILFAGGTRELRFRDPRRFGGAWFMDGDGRDGNSRLKSLGPDALSIRVPVLREICRRKRQVKALLLDQQAIGGLGNIYCDEALHGARIHPLARASDLDETQIRNLACCIRKTLRRAVAAGGSTLRDYTSANGEPGLFQIQHRVYGRAGEPCKRCGAPIATMQVASRTTHYCEVCQPKNGR